MKCIQFLLFIFNTFLRGSRAFCCILLFLSGINTKPYSSCNLLLFIVMMEVINDIHPKFVLLTIMTFCSHGIKYECKCIFGRMLYDLSRVFNVLVLVLVSNIYKIVIRIYTALGLT